MSPAARSGVSAVSVHPRRRSTATIGARAAGIPKIRGGDRGASRLCRGAPKTWGVWGAISWPPILTIQLVPDRGLNAAEVLVDVAAEDPGHLAGAHRGRAGEHRAALVEGGVVERA